MKTKTIKTPSVGLMVFQSLYAQCYNSVFKSMLLRQSHPLATTTAMVQAHRRKNLKNNLFHMNVLYIVNGFYCFSSGDVFSCRATSDDGRTCAGACSQAKSHAVSTITRSAKTSAEGFLRFLLTSET